MAIVMEFREFSFGKKVIDRTSDKDEIKEICLFVNVRGWNLMYLRLQIQQMF